MKILSLYATVNFKAGDLGYFQANGVVAMKSGFVPEGQVVRAVEDVAAGQTGRFEEIEKSK